MKRYLHALLLLLVSCVASCGGGDSRRTIDQPVNLQNALTGEDDALTTLVRLPRCPAPPTPLRKISSVQDGALGSAGFGQTVTLRGIVTGDFQAARQLHGFFMQTPVSTKPATGSEGIFVTLPQKFSHVVSGHYVQVSGNVEELKNKTADTTRLAKLVAVTAVSDCGDSAAPAPRSLNFPVDTLGRLSALEGMLVRVSSAMTVTDNHDLGLHGTLLLSPDGRLWQPNNHPSLTDPAQVADLNQRSQILLDDGVSALRPNPLPYLSASDAEGTRRAGDSVDQIEGILTRLMGDWRLQPTRPPVFTIRNPRPPAPASYGELRIGSMNVLSFFTTLDARGAKSDEEFGRQRDKLVSAIIALDPAALGLMEIENNTEALENLVDAINRALGHDTYAALHSGVAGTDEIRVAILYQPERLALIGAPELLLRPARAGTALALRPPLAQLFSDRRTGAAFWLVINHLKSKSRCGGADSFDHDRGQGCWNLTRTSQARALDKSVSMLVAQSGEPQVLLIGDFNAYLAEDPIRLLENHGYENLLWRLPAADRYSYVFAGQAGALDHGFASTALQSQISSIAIWHTSADEPSTFDYSTSSKPDDRYAATPWRASDHDPLLIGITFGEGSHRR